MNTPEALPANRSGAWPAFSSARQAVSSRIRCCGSIEAASRGEMWKKAASKRSTPSRKAPHLVVARSRAPASSRRPGGNSPTASNPSQRNRQNRSGRSEERRVGKEVSVGVDLGGRRIIKNKKKIDAMRRERNKE